MICLFYFVVGDVRAAAQLAQRIHDDGGRKSLAHQVLIEAPFFSGVEGTSGAVPQLLLQGAGDERTLVFVSEDVANCLGGDTLGNAPGLQLANDTQPSAAFDFGGGAGVGCGELLVVEAARFEESRDGGVDVGLAMLAIAEAVTAFADRQRPPRQHVQRVDVGGQPVISHQTG